MKNKGDYYYEDDYMEEDKNPKIKKIALIISIVVIAFILIFSAVIFKKKYHISSMTKKAENLIEIEDYDEAIKIYSELYTDTGNIEYKSEINKLQIKKEIKSNLEEADKASKEGEHITALKLYLQVPKEDEKAYKKASSEIDSLKSSIIRKASSLADSGNNASATSILSDYISLVPDDQKAVDLLKKVSGKNDSEIKQIIVNGGETYVPDSTSSANSLANRLKSTYQYITSGKANIRSGPSKGASVVGTLYKGDAVYIYDTYVESASRIWCKTDYGWISYNTMNYTIR